MRRPLFVAGLSMFIATWLAFMCPDESVAGISAASALTAALCLVLRGRYRYARVFCVIFLTAAAAFASYYLYLERTLVPVRALSGRNVVVEGLITEVEHGASATTHKIKVSFPGYADLAKNMTVTIRTLDGFEQSAGDTVRLKARFHSAPDTLWYKSRGILLIGQNARDIGSIPAGRYRLEQALLKMRDKLALNLYGKLSETNAAIVSAMTLGMMNDIPTEIYSAVSKSGTAHLLSISGLHLSIFSAFFLGLLKRLRCPDKPGAAITISLCFLFATTVGFGSSVFRSFVMTAIALSGKVVSRRADSLTSLGLALIVCAGFWPNWAMSWGLWLSAGSTMGIIIFGDKLTGVFYERLKRGGKGDRLVKTIANGAAVSVAAYAFTLPVLLLMSGWISIVSPLANILITPFIPVAILGGIACALVPGLPFPMKLIAAATDFSTSAIVKISEVLAGLPFAVIAIDEGYLLIWLAALCVFVFALVYFKAGKKLVSYALALSLFSYSAGDLSLAAANSHKLELAAFSTRDSAVLLRGKEAVILGTPSVYEISNLLRYLGFRGVKTITAVIAADCGDRVGSGLLRLADTYEIQCVIGPNDAFIVGILEDALPDSIVYSGGYAEITALGGAKITTDLQNENIYVTVGKNQIVKIRGEYDIIEHGNSEIQIYDDGVVVLPKQIPPAFEPVGAHLFGESRVLLDTGG